MSHATLTLAELRALMDQISFNRLLGLRLTRRHRDGVTVECPIREEYTNLHGTLHGGVTAALADVAAGFAVIAHAQGRPVATVEMKLNYLAPIHGRRVTARAHLLKAGSTLCVCAVDVFTERRRLAAKALVTYMLLPAPLKTS